MTRHDEHHRVDRVGWLRAGVLGANDGLISTSSLIIGVAAASPTPGAIFVAALAAWVAGALAMAAGEYVSVSSQADSEKADLARERGELAADPAAEREELAQIYVGRGLDLSLAYQVADQLMAKDAVSAHARDELGISEITAARPLQAALASAATFTVGAALPTLLALLTPPNILIAAVVLSSLAFLALLGGVGAATGGAPVMRGVIRVTVGGAIAMAVSALVGRISGAVV